LQLNVVDNSQFDMNEYLAKTVLEQLPFPVLPVNMHGHICYSNEAVETLLSYRNEELNGMPIEKIILSNEQVHEVSQINQVKSISVMQTSGIESIGFGRKKDGVTLLVDIKQKRVNLWNGVYQLYTITDMTPYHEQCEAVTSAAHTDSLTEVFNRRGLKIYFEYQLLRFKRDATPLSLMFIDIDNFKRINDMYGHHYGDEVLIKMASIIGGASRDLDIICRYGGDEFAVLLPETCGADVRGIAERIQRKVNAHDWGDFRVTCSIGYTVLDIPDYQDRETDWLENSLLACADKAMYASKQSGRNCISSRTFREKH